MLPETMSGNEIERSALEKVFDMNSSIERFKRFPFDRRITMRQAQLLHSLWSLGHPPTLSEIAEIDRSGTTQACRQLTYRLEHLGYIVVDVDEQDRRAVRILLTEDGSKVGEAYEGFFRELTSLISKDMSEDELKIVARFLDSFINVLGKRLRPS